MLIAGLIVAAIGGALYMMQAFGRSSSRMAIGSGAAALGAAVTPVLMDQCGFAAEATAVDHLFAYGLMAGGAWLALVITKAFLRRGEKKSGEDAAFAGEIRTGGFRLGWWVPWALLAPTLIILVIFLYTPAVQTFTLSSKLARLGAPRQVEVCFANFTELLIPNAVALVAYPLISLALIFGARFWRNRSEKGTIGHTLAEVASILAALSVFVALYLMFSPGGGGSVAYRPVYVTTMIISVGIVVFGMTAGLAVAVLAFRGIRGGGAYRTMLVWPYAISPAVAGILFFMILDPTAGIVNHLAEVWFGWDFPNYREDPFMARFAIIMASSWKIIGFNILFYLAGLQTVPREQMEAAALDGATAWQRFTNVIIPALSPITFFLLVTNLTYAFFEVYATIDFMTKGAPAGATSVAIYEIIRVGVNNGDLGRGAAQSVLLFAAVIGVTMWQFRTSGERVTYGGA